MFIVPMSGITPLEFISQKKVEEVTAVENSGSFVDIFKEALNNVQETQKQTSDDSIRYALGEIDDIGQIQINTEKAAMAIDTFVAIKNTAMDAYNEIMRMSI